MTNAADSTNAAKKRNMPGTTKLVVAAAVAIGVGALYALMPGAGEAVSMGTTFTATRGPLEILVMESGNVVAQQKQEIRSRVEKGGTTILFLMEEGTRITKEDVENRIVLVELDPSDLQDRLDSESIQFQNTESQFKENEQQVELQISTNEASIRQQKLTLKFALMDLQKFLGEGPVADVLTRLGLGEKHDEIEQLIREQGVGTVSVAIVPGGVQEGTSAGRLGDMATDSELLKGDPAASAHGGSEGGGRSGDWQQGQGRPGGGQGEWTRGEGRPGGGRGGFDPARMEEMRQRRAEGGQGRPGGRGGRPGGQGGSPWGGGGGGYDPERMREMMESGDMPEGMRDRMEAMRTMMESGEISEEVRNRMRESGFDPSQFGRQPGGERGGGADEEEMELTEEELAYEPPEIYTVKLDSAYEAARNAIDFSQYADIEKLEDGQAKQELRIKEDDILIAEEQLELARTQLEGTQELFEKEFANQSELDRDKATFNQRLLRFESSKTDFALYTKYEFVKMAEQMLSNYEEALMDLLKVHTQNNNQLMREKMRLRYSKRRYDMEQRELDELEEQIEACVMVAERPGLIVYGGGQSRGGRYGGGGNDTIEEGATVRNRQVIMNIPDMTTMAVQVQVHESAVQKVHAGQRVRLRVAADTDVLITGTVEKVSAVADSGNMWMQPDLKAYPTTVVIDGEYEWLRPGMSADVEIIVDQLEDVLYVPLQAVTYFGESQRAVYVAGASGPERRIVETGSFSDDFIEIVEGLSEGEQVYLRIPDSMRTDENMMSTAI